MAEEIKWGNSWAVQIFTPKVEWLENIMDYEIKCELVLMSDTQLTFQCDCGTIHDPETNSFTKLIESARTAGWLIRFKDQGYNVKCKECK